MDRDTIIEGLRAQALAIAAAPSEKPKELSEAGKRVRAFFEQGSTFGCERDAALKLMEAVLGESLGVQGPFKGGTVIFAIGENGDEHLRITHTDGINAMVGSTGNWGTGIEDLKGARMATTEEIETFFDTLPDTRKVNRALSEVAMARDLDQH